MSRNQLLYVPYNYRNNEFDERTERKNQNKKYPFHFQKINYKIIAMMITTWAAPPLLNQLFFTFEGLFLQTQLHDILTAMDSRY